MTMLILRSLQTLVFFNYMLQILKLSHLLYHRVRHQKLSMFCVNPQILSYCQSLLTHVRSVIRSLVRWEIYRMFFMPQAMDHQYLTYYRLHKSRKHPSRIFSCGHASCRPCKDEKSLKRHLETAKAHRKMAYTCHCRYSSARWDKFKLHLSKCNTKREDSSSYKCICNETYMQTSDLENHNTAKHRGRKGRPSMLKLKS